MAEFTIKPNGPFSLAAAQDFAGGFTAGIGGGGVDASSIVMSFPIERWQSSAAVALTQAADGTINAQTDSPGSDLDAIRAHAARSLSLDHDGIAWPDVGKRDPVVGRLQEQFRFLRPVCFYSAYEAAASFVLGQRISMRQNARIKEQLRETLGERPTVGGRGYPAFPRPQVLLAADELPGVPQRKIEWLHGVARAALNGHLDTATLRAMPYADALANLREIPAIGPWTAEAILLRGCGIADELPANDPVTLRAVATLYERPGLTQDDLVAMAETWRPYRMWAVVLLRVGWNRTTRPTSYRVD